MASWAELLKMERVKEQYEQYLEVSKIYELPIFQPEPEPQYLPPSSEHPLTSNKTNMKQRGFYLATYRV